MTTAPSAPRLPMVLPTAIAGAWLLVLAVEVTGDAGVLHHDALIEGELPARAALPLFLLAWQVMITAMMLPSSLPLIRLFIRASRHQPRPGVILAAFLGGYVLVWSVFGALAFLGDLGLHEAVHRSSWLESNQPLIAGGTLLVAGLLQSSPLTRRCLTECRQPGSFLAANYARGIYSAFRLGRKHGLFCVGCCAALMLLMFAAGVANLLWMASLTALMVYQKTGRSGTRASSAAGIILFIWAVAVLADPAWLPSFLTSPL